MERNSMSKLQSNNLSIHFYDIIVYRSVMSCFQFQSQLKRI